MLLPLCLLAHHGALRSRVRSIPPIQGRQLGWAVWILGLFVPWGRLWAGLCGCSPCGAAAPSPPLRQLLFPKGASHPLLPFLADLGSGCHGDGGRNWIRSPAGINPSCCLLLLLSSQRIFNKVTAYRSLVFVLLSLCCVLNPEGFHHNLLLSQALQIPPLLHELCPLDPGDISFPDGFYFWN